jgi:hypothetical protein
LLDGAAGLAFRSALAGFLARGGGWSAGFSDLPGLPLPVGAPGLAVLSSPRPKLT